MLEDGDVIEARQDPVADLAAFGPDPNRLAGVTALSAAHEILDRVERAESLGHSEYLHESTSSQYGIAAVVAGSAERAPRGDGAGGGDVVRDVLPLLLRPGGIGP